MPANLILTGVPGSGKTTVIRKVLEQIPELNLAGFYTKELKRDGRRIGFEAIGLTGERADLARLERQAAHQVGRYGVDLARFEPLVAQELEQPADGVDVYVVDEIGKMECCSKSFIAQVRRLLDGKQPVLATVGLKAGGFPAEVRERKDVDLIAIDSKNRDDLPRQLVKRIKQLLK